MTPNHREKNDQFCPTTTTEQKNIRDAAADKDLKEREKLAVRHEMDSYPYRVAMKRHSYQYRYNNK